MHVFIGQTAGTKWAGITLFRSRTLCWPFDLGKDFTIQSSPLCHGGAGGKHERHQDWRLEAPSCRVYAIKLLTRENGIVASEISHPRVTVAYCSEQWDVSKTERWCPHQKLAWAMAGILGEFTLLGHQDVRWSFVQDSGAEEGRGWVFLKPVRGRGHSVVGI